MQKQLLRVCEVLEKVIKGKSDVLEQLVIALISEGSVLLRDVPGVGKTTLAKTLAGCLSAQFRRIQFTPDLLPTDIIGSSIYNAKDGELRFRKGPVFTNILLADEINRASPRTQSALLEVMSEQQVSADGVTYVLESPFIVLATENPIEYQGTYELPEAQLDRFAMQLSLGYPDNEAEIQLFKDRLHGDPAERVSEVLSCEELVEIQKKVKMVTVDESLLQYVLRVIGATRKDARISLGASPRGGLLWIRAAQASAFLYERDFVTVDDLKKLAIPVLAHRVILEKQSQYSGLNSVAVITEILHKIAVPR